MKKIMMTCFVSCLSLYGAQSNDISSTPSLTPQESACFTWIEQTKKLIEFKYTYVSQEAQDTFNQGILHRDNPQKVEAACANYATAFYQCALNYQCPLGMSLPMPYGKDIIEKLIIKMTIIRQNKTVKPTDYVSARLFSFNQLTAEEQASFRKINYMENSQATYAAAEKLGKILAQHLAELKIIPDTVEAKEKAAQEHCQKKIEDLKREYEQS